jgi:O-antigen/teichoic acid export membrane protein
MIPTRFRHDIRNGAYAAFDQALSSGTNFITAFVAARILGPTQFGLVAIAMSAAFLSITVHRALVGEPALVYLSTLPRLTGRRAERDALAAAVGIGILAGALCMIIGATRVGLVGDLLRIGPWLPFVILQDGVRYVAFARRRPDLAVVSDGTWAISQTVTLLALIMFDLQRSAGFLIATWGLGGAIGAGVGLWLLGLTPRFGRAPRWLRTSWGLARWLLPQTALSQGIAQLSTMIIGALLGSHAVGGFRAVQTLVMPIGAAITAAIALLVPKMTIVLDSRGPRAQYRLARMLAIEASILAVLPAAIMIAFSAAITRVVYGDDYVKFHSLLLPFVLSSLLQIAGVPAGAGQRSLRDGRRIFLSQVMMSGVGLPAMLLLTSTIGLPGAAWSVFLQTAVMSTVAWVLYRSRIKSGVRREEHEGVAVDSHSVA